ncbi:MAG: formate dehydrogenase accessory protein FdhE [Thermofilaceae archaeon]
MGIREKIGLIRGYIPADDATVEAFSDLLEKQAQLKTRYAETLSRVDVKSLGRTIAEGKPAASEAGIWLTEEEIAEGVRAVASVIGERIPREAEKIRSVLDAIGEGKLNLRELAQALLRGELSEAEIAAEQVGVDPAVLGSLVAWSLQPAYAALSEAVTREADLSGWSTGRCPVCGSYAALGFIDREGAFHLKCQFCGTEWGYPSSKCPFCGNDESDLISVIDLGEGRPLLLDICHVCGGYWKVVDERLSTVDVPRDLYDLWTLILDALAKRFAGR